MKKNLFKIKKNFQKENFKTEPDIFWMGIVIVSFLVILGSFIFAYNLFVEVNKETSVTDQPGTQKISSKEKEKIKSALDYFSEREKNSTEILNSQNHITDPSL